jgi:N-carbamoyl-L-amino-acid hydrolase
MLLANEKRLWSSLMDMAEIGALPHGGCCRLALTDEDRAGRDRFVTWCRESGCVVRIDAVGNIYARRPGMDPERPAVATGSHLDTQPHGGRFDGIYGVLAGLEVIRSLNDADIRTRSPIDVIVWTNEEGARFSPPLAGSSTFIGKFRPEEIHDLETHDGARVGDELDRIGYRGDEEPGSRRLDAFFEAHIEQGPILESRGMPIGVVTGIQGIRWFDVQVSGTDSHAGTVPMDLRQDALMGASRMVSAARELALGIHAEVRLTVGRLDIEPNSGSTIPGRVSFNIDLRHPEQSVLDEIESGLEREFARIAHEEDLAAAMTRTIEAPPVRFDTELVESVGRATEGLGHDYLVMISGAGHDAMNLALKVPTAMIFIPCKDGLSHNEAEFATSEHCAAGASVLLNAMLARAVEVS